MLKMYIKFNSYSAKCVFLITFCVVVLINSVQSEHNRYILPVLPETHYTLNDVIIIPESADTVEITITYVSISTELATWNLTVEHEFRLGHVLSLQNLSVESGLQLTTSCKTTVIIDLPGGLLTLPPFAENGLIHHIFTVSDNNERIFQKPLVIQSEIPHTLIKLCIIMNNIKNNTSEKLEPNFQDRNNTEKCSNLTTSAIGRYILNESSTFNRINHIPGFFGVEITSEHPISILQGHLRHMSGLERNKHENNTSNSRYSQTKWRVITPLSNRSSTFVVIPSTQKRDYTFYILCSVDSWIDFQSVDDLITMNVTANKPINASFTISPDSIMTVTIEHGFSLDCIKSDHSTCNGELLPVNSGSMIHNNHSLNIYKKQASHRWIYLSNDANLFILFPNDTDVNVASINGSICTINEVRFNISNIFLKLISLTRSQNGLYTISSKNTVDTYFLYYLSNKISTNSFDNRQNQTNEIETSIHSVLSNKGSDLITNNDSSASNGYSTTLPKNQTADNSEQTMPHFSKVDETTIDNSASFLPAVDNFKTTSSDISTAPDTENTKLSDENKQLTQAASGIPGSNGKDNVITVQSDINETFKAVVDIFHSKEGRKDILIDNSKTKEAPNYTYRFNVNNNIGQVGDGKNPVAIIVSLLSAILAVGAIILIFLLKDFFSRRQHIRKTRIRPFISYY
ncbi:uncharacterized protein LOC132723902 [Ruditapes philippinarum]|uniref:uncharacterized protein LOC132723902 n=1 Tax=Ruditapes philippinarum TaxID=129788 RepID=UPI00295BCA88|nr:uncharacterized protein LOC132723902 [Ruditapes philippinarum]